MMEAIWTLNVFQEQKANLGFIIMGTLLTMNVFQEKVRLGFIMMGIIWILNMFQEQKAIHHEGTPTDTERVPGTESEPTDVGFGDDDERDASLHKCSDLAGETMQLDEELHSQENLDPTAMNREGNNVGCCSGSRMEDTHTGTIRTAELIASEVAGSWAVSSASSVNGENDSPTVGGTDADGSGVNADADAATALLLCSNEQASGSQNGGARIVKLSREHQALNSMIELIAPELNHQFRNAGDQEKMNESISDAETKEGSNASDDDNTDGEDVVMSEDSVE